MICPHCNQAKMHEDIAVFTSSLDPSGDSLPKYKGMSCKNCGHWVDIIEIEKPLVPTKEKSNNLSGFNYRLKEKEANRAYFTKYFEYLKFLRDSSCTWKEIALRFKQSQSAIKSHYFDIQKGKYNENEP